MSTFRAGRSAGHTGRMPELPEVAALAAFLTGHATGQHIAAVTVASLNVMTTYDPPTSTPTTSDEEYMRKRVVRNSENCSAPPVFAYIPRPMWSAWRLPVR